MCPTQNLMKNVNFCDLSWKKTLVASSTVHRRAFFSIFFVVFLTLIYWKIHSQPKCSEARRWEGEEGRKGQGGEEETFCSSEEAESREGIMSSAKLVSHWGGILAYWKRQRIRFPDDNLNSQEHYPIINAKCVNRKYSSKMLLIKLQRWIKLSLINIALPGGDKELYTTLNCPLKCCWQINW